MPKASPFQSNFGGGEFSPLLYGRVDSDRYPTGLGTCLNYVPTVQGGLMRRQGTYFANEVKTSAKKTRAVRFEFSSQQAYVLEFGDQYIRFYRNEAIIESSPGVPYEVATPFLEADLFELHFNQSADTLFISHAVYGPYVLTRTGHTSWTLNSLKGIGPYLPINTTTTTITPSATSGIVTLTASANLFAPTDVGRKVRIRHSTTWGFATITAYTSPAQVTAITTTHVFGATTASAAWRLGAWSDTTGYPAVSVFHEDRLCYAGCPETPQRIDGSEVGNYFNFEPTDPDGTITASHPVSFTLASSDVNVVRWMTSDEKGLLAGTVAGEWVIRPSSQQEALSPTNITAKQTSRYGSAEVHPVQVGKATIFVQRAGKRLREMYYFYDVDGFRATDLTVLSEHITGSGVVEMAFMKEPQPIVWCVLQDGSLAGMTYERDVDGFKVGWHRHQLGGVGDADGNPPAVESICVIPNPEGTADQLWMVVRRYINGQTVRYMEFMTPFFDHLTALEDAFFVDCGRTYTGPSATTLSGLDHLEGESVDVLSNGASLPKETVSGGEITLPSSTTKAHVGYAFRSRAQLLPFEAGAADGTALGKTRRTHRTGVLVYRTFGMRIGMNFDEMTEITFRKGNEPMSSAPALKSGVFSETLDADYDTENQIAIEQYKPYPGTILAVMPQLVTQDR